uniref:Uncharacterized protein n=1 Tax=Ciona savignyi TaxID=51511 RepID=H2YJ11_CIOSA
NQVDENEETVQLNLKVDDDNIRALERIWTPEPLDVNVDKNVESVDEVELKFDENQVDKNVETVQFNLKVDDDNIKALERIWTPEPLETNVDENVESVDEVELKFDENQDDENEETVQINLKVDDDNIKALERIWTPEPLETNVDENVESVDEVELKFDENEETVQFNLKVDDDNIKALERIWTPEPL